MREINKTKICLSVFFAAMLVLLMMQFSKVHVYFDDYGYYALSYCVNIGHSGNTFTFAELLEFLKVHYMSVNGRIPGYFIWLSTYILGGLGGVQMVSAVLLFAALCLLWKFNAGERPFLSAVLIFALYGLFTINVQRQGTYWFAAFFQYVAPIAPLTLFYILYFKWRESGFRIKNILILSALVLLSAYSQEQLSVTVSFSMVLLILLEIIEKKPWKQNLLFLALAAASALALILCPAAQSRAGAQGRTLTEQIVYSTHATIHTFFSNDFKIFLMILFLTLTAVSIALLKKERFKILKLADIVSIGIGVVSVIVYCNPALQNALAGLLTNKYLLILSGGAVAAVIAVQMMRYYWDIKSYPRLILFMTAVGSIGCLCIVPEVPARLFLPSWLLLFPTLADGVGIVADSFEQNKKLQYGILIAITAAVVLASGMNAVSIYKGYAGNQAALEYNDAVLEQAAEDIENGIAVESVYLKTYPYSEHCAIEPYHEAILSMKGWVRNYYGMKGNPDFYYSENGTEQLPDGNAYRYLDFGIYIES